MGLKKSKKKYQNNFFISKIDLYLISNSMEGCSKLANHDNFIKHIKQRIIKGSKKRAKDRI